MELNNMYSVAVYVIGRQRHSPPRLVTDIALVYSVVDLVL